MISDEKLQKIIKWSPDWPKEHRGQQDILKAFNGGKDTIVIEAGTRWGKTELASYLVLKTFLIFLGEIGEKKRDSVKIWIVAPTYDLTKKVFDNFVKWFLMVDSKQAGVVSYRPFPQVNLARGVWVQGKSATEPESLLGEELDLMVIDEASRVKREIWNSYLFARLASRKGKVIMISTPFGRNWFHEEYLKAKGIGGGFHFRTIDNPYFPPEKWVEAKKTLPEQVFKQEYEADALPDAAGVFRGVDEIIKDNALQDVLKDHRYVMGVDLGRHEDFTVICVIDKWNNNLVYFDRFREISYPFQKARIKAVAERYNSARVFIDSTGAGEPVFEDLRMERIFIDDFKFTKKSKEELVKKLSIFIEQKKVFIPPNEILIDELKAFGYHLTEAGNVVYKAPQGLYDDAVMAFALAVWGLQGKAELKTPLQKQFEKSRREIQIENFV